LENQCGREISFLRSSLLSTQQPSPIQTSILSHLVSPRISARAGLSNSARTFLLCLSLYLSISLKRTCGACSGAAAGRGLSPGEALPTSGSDPRPGRPSRARRFARARSHAKTPPPPLTAPPTSARLPVPPCPASARLAPAQPPRKNPLNLPSRPTRCVCVPPPQVFASRRQGWAWRGGAGGRGGLDQVG